MRLSLYYLKNQIMKNQISFLFLLATSLIFSQCKKEEIVKSDSQNLGQINLSENMKSIVPYKKDDSFVLKSSTGDSAKFEIVSRSSNFLRMHENGGTDPSTNTYDFEQNTTIYSDECGHDYIITINAPLPSTFLPLYKGKSELYIQFCLPDCKFPTILQYSDRVLFDDNQFYSYNDNSNIVFYDSLTLINKKFYSVIELKNSKTPVDSSTYDYVTSMYYCKNDGIVGVQTKKGKIWCLQ